MSERERGHAIVCGYGRVSSIVCALLEQHGKPFIVIEEDLTALFGDAGLPVMLDRAHLGSARLLILCIPDVMTARRALEYAREVRSDAATVLARTHSDEDRILLQKMGADEAVVGEMELALELGRRALERFGIDPRIVERSLQETRRTLT